MTLSARLKPYLDTKPKAVALRQTESRALTRTSRAGSVEAAGGEAKSRAFNAPRGRVRSSRAHTDSGCSYMSLAPGTLFTRPRSTQ